MQKKMVTQVVMRTGTKISTCTTGLPSCQGLTEAGTGTLGDAQNFNCDLRATICTRRHGVENGSLH